MGWGVVSEPCLLGKTTLIPAFTTSPGSRSAFCLYWTVKTYPRRPHSFSPLKPLSPVSVGFPSP